MATDPREPLGRIVHEQRLAFNAERERPFVLLPWEERDDRQRELDMRIGEAVATEVRADAEAKLAAVREHCQKEANRFDGMVAANRILAITGEPQDRSEKESP